MIKKFKQTITAISVAGKTLRRYAEGNTPRELWDNMDFIMTNKKDRPFSAAINNKDGKIKFPDTEVYSNKYLKKGTHVQKFLKNCNLKFDKQVHRDIMCMVKSKFSTLQMEEAIPTSPSNLKTLKKEIFEILLVNTYLQELQKLN